MLEKSSTSYLGPGCREFESRHSDQKNAGMAFAIPAFLLFDRSETRRSKCNADERCRRGLDRADP